MLWGNNDEGKDGVVEGVLRFWIFVSGSPMIMSAISYRYYFHIAAEHGHHVDEQVHYFYKTAYLQYALC